ncbi:MAG: flagellar filament capping protein FliD [Thiobacillus sp.]
MASISSSTTTAFDVTKLVSQLMAVERRPIDTLNNRISDTQAKISSFGTLSGLVSAFQSAALGLRTGLQKLTTTPSDPLAFSATPNGAGVPGTYSVEVSQLAQSQSLVAAGQASRTAAIGDGTATTLTFDFGTISGGTLGGGIYSGATFTASGAGSASVVIDSSNNTLEGIRDAINAANLGIGATIVNDGSGTPYRLALSSVNSGVNNSLRISVSGGDGSIDSLLGYDPAGTQNLTQTRSAQNAQLTVNGIPITSASNTLTEAIQGASLTLKNVTSSPANLSVSRDTAAINAAVTAFVDAYNALASQIKSRSAFAVGGNSAGVLAGDSGLRQMQSQLSDIFTSPVVTGTLSSLAQVGIAFKNGGQLQFDSATFNNALAADFDDVVNLIASPTGFATRLEDWARGALSAGGVIESRTQSLRDFVKDRNAEVDRLEQRMALLEKKYTQEYTNLNLLLSRMNTTSTFLTQQLLAQPKSE